MKNVVNIVCLLFLITSPIGQWIFGLGGGFLAFVFAENDSQSHIIAPKLMGFLSLVSIFGFAMSKSKTGKLITTISSTFFICNFVLSFSSQSKMIPHYFYPQSFIIGSMVSFIILKSIEKVKPKKDVSQNWF